MKYYSICLYSWQLLVLCALWVTPYVGSLVLGKAFYLQDDSLLIQPLCSVLDRLLLRPIMTFLLPDERREATINASVCVCVCVWCVVCVCIYTQNCLCTIVLCSYSNLQLVIERGKSERSLRRMDKTKFLVPEEITISQLLAILRYGGHRNNVLGNGFPILIHLSHQLTCKGRVHDTLYTP